MRQIIYFLLLTFILLSQCNEDEEKLGKCVETKPENGKKDCNNNSMPEKMKCCYVKYKLGNTEYFACSAIINTEREIKEYKDMLKDAKGVDIQCHSSFVTLSLWLIVLVLGIV